MDSVYFERRTFRANHLALRIYTRQDCSHGTRVVNLGKGAIGLAQKAMNHASAIGESPDDLLVVVDPNRVSDK